MKAIPLQTNLEMNFKINMKTVRLIEISEDNESITIAYPSYTHVGRTHLTTYNLKDKTLDSCSCDGKQFKDTCWHLNFRYYAFQLLLNRIPAEDISEVLERFNPHDTKGIAYYLWSKCHDYLQFCSDDIQELKVFDENGCLRDERIKGSTFRMLSQKKIIREIGRRRTRNRSQRRAWINVWRWERDEAVRYFRG